MRSTLQPTVAFFLHRLEVALVRMAHLEELMALTAMEYVYLASSLPTELI